MSTKVVMEALSPTMEEGRLVEWKKNEGDAVAVGDVLAEVETDKAVMELVARTAGTMLKHVVAAGATVPVSEPVAIIGEAGEDVGGAAAEPRAEAKAEPNAEAKAEPKSEAKAGTKAEAAKAGATPPVASSATATVFMPRESQATQPAPDQNRPTSMPRAPAAEAATEAAPVAPAAAAPTAAPSGESGRVKASPLARKIAADRGLDLQGVAGSGPAGRIVQRDLASLAANGGKTGAPSTPVAPFSPATSGEPFRDVPLSQIRKTIAKRLVQSIGPVPTFYLTTEVDVERLAEAREALNALGEGKVSFNDITIKAVALALLQHPACNAWWQDDAIRYWNDVHISMAVAIDEGLITPVIRYADQKSLRQIAAESRDLAARARERRLKPDEYTGGTFSISNLGMLDIDEFTAIINPPEAGILAVGRISERVVAHEGEIAIRRRMRLTMSCDHRVIDGATGAQFLKTLKAMLENPLALVW